MFLDKKVLILGIDGLIGGSLFLFFQKYYKNIYGTTRRNTKLKSNVYFFDIAQLNSFSNIPWSKFEIIIDCIGYVEHQKSLNKAIKCIDINTLGPLRILSHLTTNQSYYFCSTHIVSLPLIQHTVYSLSKSILESYIEVLSDVTPKIISLRVPGIFSEKRDSGVLNMIKNNFYKNIPITLNLATYHWHAMYLPRFIEILKTIIEGEHQEKSIVIGYPLEIKIEYILDIAQKVIGHRPFISIIRNESDHYTPDLKAQNHFIHITKEDFEQDLTQYFKKV